MDRQGWAEQVGATIRAHVALSAGQEMRYSDRTLRGRMLSRRAQVALRLRDRIRGE